MKMREENNEYEKTSKIGAYGNVIGDDKTLINTEISYIEDNKSLASNKISVPYNPKIFCFKDANSKT